MFDARRTTWDSLGKDITGAVNSEQAMKFAGLDWQVRMEDVQYNGQGTGFKFTIREDNNKVLGVVRGRYTPVQNKDAFAFTDELIGGDVKYETAGALNGGKRIWMLAKLPEQAILGDEIVPYLVLTNTHDGTGSLKACMTPIRVVCQNTLNLALKTATRTWSVRHSSGINGRMEEARQTLMLAKDYMINLADEAEELAGIKVSENQLETLLAKMFPYSEDAGVRKITSQEALKSYFHEAWNMEDLNNIRGTGWGFLNAMSDMVTHRPPSRKTENYRENLFIQTLDNPAVMDQAYRLIKEL